MGKNSDKEFPPLGNFPGFSLDNLLATPEDGQEMENNETLDTRELDASEILQIREHLQKTPFYPPKEIDRLLVKAGYRGQKQARKAGSVLAYRHLQRLRRTYVDGAPQPLASRKENYLFLGTTGSGKTFLVELLFREILRVPALIADATRFSETGYIGDDVNMLLSQLFELAGQERGWASCGVICLDEFDKLATSRSSARFAGEGTTKDVSGFGVQRGLLTLLSGSHANFPTDFGYSGHGAQLSMPLNHLTFIACGAFSGLKGLADLTATEESQIGFGGKAISKEEERIANEVSNRLLEDTKAFSQYGILPELIGRFSRLVPFQPLPASVLKAILEDNLLRDYRDEFESEGVELIVEQEVIDQVVGAAHRRETGARGLRASLVPFLEDAAFEVFGQERAHRVRLHLDGEQVRVQCEEKAKIKASPTKKATKKKKRSVKKKTKA